jgi:hypothetical protein
VINDCQSQEVPEKEVQQLHLHGLEEMMKLKMVSSMGLRGDTLWSGRRTVAWRLL